MDMHQKRLAAQKARRAYFKHRATQGIVLDAPTILNLVPPQADGTEVPPGLISASALENPLEITIPKWLDFSPGSEDRFKELLHLQWRPKGSTEDFLTVNSIEIRGPETDHTFPLQEQIPVEAFKDYKNAEFEFTYQVITWNGGEANNAKEVPLVIDAEPPYGTGSLADLMVSEDHVVDTNKDNIIVNIPPYSDSKVGDKIALYWLAGKVPDNPEDLLHLTPIGGGPMLVPASLTMTVPKEKIEEIGDGDCYAVYVLIDLAGNASRIGRSNRVQVTLGLLPVEPLPAPTVRHADHLSDGIIDREDAFAGVFVDIESEITNWKLGDYIGVKWGDTQLAPHYISVFPVAIPVAWDVLKKEYDFLTSDPSLNEQSVTVQYSLVRGTYPFSSLPTTVQVDFAKVGPDNPDEPDPVNSALGLVRVVSSQAVENIIDEGDRGQEAHVLLAPYDGILKGQEIEFFWQGKSVSKHTVDAEVPGDPDIDITVPWAIVDAGGNGDIKVYFKVSHPDYLNTEDSKPTTVAVSAIEVVLPMAVFPKIDPTLQWLNCPSLELNESQDAYGITVHIPASRFLLKGTKVKIKWESFIDRNTTDPLDGGELESQEFTVTEDQELNGLNWWAGPYETLLEGIYGADGDNYGSAKVTYTVDNNPSEITEVVVAMFIAGSGCIFTKKP